MNLLLQGNAQSIVPVVHLVTIKPEPSSKLILFKCSNLWSEFIRCLSSTSPVCALMHPSDRLSALIQAMCKGDISRNATLMKTLQEEIPVLFKLISSLTTYPCKVLSPLLKVMFDKSIAPFAISSHAASLDCEEVIASGQHDNLSYFPSQTKRRIRGHYQADQKKSGPICTKHASQHPSLLPGIFTLFCQHGKKVYTVEYNIYNSHDA